MSYELRHDEGIGDGLRLICRKQIDLALQIVNGESEPDDTPVHEVRKHIKKARAAVHLLKKEIGRGFFKRQDQCLRDVGRLISDIRTRRFACRPSANCRASSGGKSGAAMPR
jgi:hypothetical protein